MKSIVWMTREKKMLNQYAVDNPIPRYQSTRVLSNLFRDPGGMLSRHGECWAATTKPPDIWDTHGISGNVFVNPLASSSSPYPGGVNPWISNVSEDTSPHLTSERQNPDTTLDPRWQSGSSARIFIRPQWWKIFKNIWSRLTKTADFGTSFVCCKIRFKTEVCTCSQCRQIHVTRHFLMRIACVWLCESHHMAQDEPPNVSVCALHSIFMPSMMCAWAFVGCSLSVSLVCLSLAKPPWRMLSRNDKACMSKNWKNSWLEGSR